MFLNSCLSSSWHHSRMTSFWIFMRDLIAFQHAKALNQHQNAKLFSCKSRFRPNLNFFSHARACVPIEKLFSPDTRRNVLKRRSIKAGFQRISFKLCEHDFLRNRATLRPVILRRAVRMLYGCFIIWLLVAGDSPRLNTHSSSCLFAITNSLPSISGLWIVISLMTVNY